MLCCTSFMDAKENAYHMLFLGMCITIRGIFRVTDNREIGYGRSDITLESQQSGISSIIVGFKQGEVICAGLGHDKKRCEMVYKEIHL